MLFLELAYQAVDEFSMDFFNKYFSQLVFMFNKEKNRDVAGKWAVNSVKYREALGLY